MTTNTEDCDCGECLACNARELEATAKDCLRCQRDLATTRRQLGEARDLVFFAEAALSEGNADEAHRRLNAFVIAAAPPPTTAPTPAPVDPVAAMFEAARDVPCPLLHSNGRAACYVVSDAGGDTEALFCLPRIRAALLKRP